MKKLLIPLFLFAFTLCALGEEEVFEYTVGENGSGSVTSGAHHDHAGHDHSGHDHAGHDHENCEVDIHGNHSAKGIGGFLFPSMVVFGTFGAFEPGANPEDFATTEHDPLNEAGITAIEFDLDININDVFTGLAAGFIYQDSNHDWRGEFEEGFLHYHLNENIAFGGGQFLNTFGFQNSRHTHSWEFINQNLAQSRMLNEGHLTTQGGEFMLRTPGNSGLLTIGGGGVRIHEGDHLHGEEGHEHEDEHEHEHDHEDEHEDEDHEEEHHFDSHLANLSGNVFTADYRFSLPNDPTSTFKFSFADGGNDTGGNNRVYGVGYQKIWNAVDLDPSGLTPGVGAGSFMFRGEFINRAVEAFSEDGDAINFDDQGINASIHYGVTDQLTLSLRHDWVSEIKEAELGDVHRTSPALSFFLDKRRRGLLRFQYDHIQSDQIGSEHVGWMQLRLFFGGSHSHNHEH